jgi:hypothetical protein
MYRDLLRVVDRPRCSNHILRVDFVRKLVLPFGIISTVFLTFIIRQPIARAYERMI